MSIESRKLRTDSEKRRSYRKYVPCSIDRETIEDWLMIASTAPSGANKQPWHFCVVTDANLKKEIRTKSEEVEKQFYEEKISKEWHKDLEILNLDYKKPFLTEAFCLIVIFKKMYQINESGDKGMNYYVNESTGIAIGLLINAIRDSGYQSLTYTPAPMNFLVDFFGRPEGELPVMILAVGKGDPESELPDIYKKSVDELSDFYY